MDIKDKQMAEEKHPVRPSGLRSREMDDIIGRPPHWLIQWGITLFFVILVMVIGLSYLISYPEAVVAPCKFIADKPAVPVIADADGFIAAVSVHANAVVKKGDTLLYWRNSDGYRTYPVIAPASGHISFIGPLGGGEHVRKGEVLFYVDGIVSTWYAACYVPSSAVSKIKIGEKVIVDADNAARTGYGSLIGKVEYISSIETTTGYYVKVSLPAGIKNDMNKLMPIGNGLSAMAQIIIGKRRLIERLFPQMHLR